MAGARALTGDCLHAAPGQDRVLRGLRGCAGRICPACPPCVFVVTERTCDRNRQLFLEPEIKVAIFDTSLSDAPDIILALYHALGTSEPFHA